MWTMRAANFKIKLIQAYIYIYIYPTTFTQLAAKRVVCVCVCVRWGAGGYGMRGGKRGKLRDGEVE